MRARRSLNLLGSMHTSFSLAGWPAGDWLMRDVFKEGLEKGEQTAMPSAMARWMIGSMDMLRYGEMTRDQELKSTCCVLTEDEMQEGDAGMIRVAGGKRRA